MCWGLHCQGLWVGLKGLVLIFALFRQRVDGQKGTDPESDGIFLQVAESSVLVQLVHRKEPVGIAIRPQVS